LLEGKTVNLRVQEKEDLPLVAEWINDLEYIGAYGFPMQHSKAELEKEFEQSTPDLNWFLIEKKDGSKIGGIGHFPKGKLIEIGYALIPSERGKGYCTEAVKIMVDYLFLSRNIVRVQAQIDPRNIASWKVIEKAGLKKEGTIRKSFFIRGEWRDMVLYSILREEWKDPKILTKTTS